MSAATTWWLTAILLASAGVALATWSLRGDRARGRKRCPKCWYDMSGAAALREGDAAAAVLRCPECGREITHARQLARTRRRWRWALVAMLLLLAGTGCFVTGKAKRDGLESVTPTTVLILIAQWSDDPRAWYVLSDRMGLWPWQREWLSNLCIDRVESASTAPIQSDVIGMLGWITDQRAEAGRDVSDALQAFAYMMTSPDAGTRRAALIFFPRSHVEILQLVELVASHVNDPDSIVREAAVIWFSSPGVVRRQGTVWLLRFMDHPDPVVRRTAVKSMANLMVFDQDDIATTRRALQMLTSDSDPSVRAACVDVLGGSNYLLDEVNAAVHASLQDASGRVRLAALGALYDLPLPADDAQRVALTIVALEDQDMAVRVRAAELLDWAVSKRTLFTFREDLARLRGHSDPEVGAAAGLLLLKLDAAQEAGELDEY